MDFLELGERDALGDEVALGVRDAVAVEPGERLPAGAALRVLVDVNRHRLHQSTRRPSPVQGGPTGHPLPPRAVRRAGRSCPRRSGRAAGSAPGRSGAPLELVKSPRLPLPPRGPALNLRPWNTRAEARLPPRKTASATLSGSPTDG